MKISKESLLIKFILIGILLVITLSPLIVAEGEELYFEPEQKMELKVYCFDVNRSICESTTSCNITIFYPNSSRFIYSKIMSYDNNYFNYTANGSSVLGVYSAMVKCINGNDEGYGTFDFYVGRPSTDPQIKITILGIILLLGTSVMFFVGFVTIKKKPFSWSFFLFFILFLVIAINVASISLRNEAGSENIRNVFDQLGAICYYMYWFVAGLFVMIWTLTFIAEIANRKNIKRAERIGQPIDFEKW